MSVSRENRRSKRKKPALPAGVRLRVAGGPAGERSIMGVVADVSECGIGVDAFVRLEPGSVVKVEADLRPSDLPLQFAGRARVVHVTRARDGRYRIGLQFVKVAYARAAG